jgi:DNA-binding NarL/FixJ family response regulator
MYIGVIAPNLALRAGIRALLGGAEDVSQFEVVYEAASMAEYIQAAPPVEVMVIAAEAASDADLEYWLPGDDVRLAVLLLSDDIDQAQGLLDLPLRGWGILPLDSSVEELRAALQAVHEGLVVGTEKLFVSALTRPQPVGGREVDARVQALTEREGQVLQLLALGLANKQIALALNISEHTVKFHVSSIYNKLGTTNRTEAVRAGVQRGLVVL